MLLERRKPEVALAVLRASGLHGLGSGIVPLSDALTTVRVWLQCGLLTEGYSYQRAYVDGVKREGGDWLTSTEVLVSEISRLCMGMSLLDKMLGLPWRKEEEKYVRKCLLNRAEEDPSCTAGNLLVVFYVQVLHMFLFLSYISISNYSIISKGQYIQLKLGINSSRLVVFHHNRGDL